MNDYDKAFKVLQDHFDEIEALPEDHVKFGNALITIHDYVTMLTQAFHESSEIVKKHLIARLDQ